MSKIKLANDLKRLLPGQANSRIRQAILEAYQRATGAPSLNPEYYVSNITNIVQTIVNEIAIADDYEISEGTIRFDVARSYGYDGTPVTGNLVVSLTDAKEINMAKVLHADGVEPVISVPGGVARHAGGIYDTERENEILFICHKNTAGEVKRISYLIFPNML